MLTTEEYRSEIAGLIEHAKAVADFDSTGSVIKLSEASRNHARGVADGLNYVLRGAESPALNALRQLGGILPRITEIEKGGA